MNSQVTPETACISGSPDKTQLLGVVHNLLSHELVEQKFAEHYRGIGAFSLASESHPEENQDALLNESALGLFGVFDGLGGHSGGSWASHYAAIRIREYIADIRRRQINPLPGVLQAALEQVNAELYERDKGWSYLTTATTAVEQKLPDGHTKLLIANRGDSRAYVFREDTLYPLTIDNHDGQILRHPIVESIGTTDVQEAFNDQRILAGYESDLSLRGVSGASRLLTEFDNRNIVRGSLGYLPTFTETSITELIIQPGDTVLLTTDGIHDNLTETQIQRILRATSSLPNRAASILLRASAIVSTHSGDEDYYSARPKRDDMTAVVIGYK